ncbi:putative dehydrogenase [Saccharopolyspora erythraea NRRL 2338]|uniref:Uncharacterized protein n=2 Tax=Saccharopolyspora erythraea TaxID=1836 RepID=A4FEL1_SACEN|nr:Gfo/Idh/MocA family oxidoreductase [Saccharopolyspora erythraea]EQD83542.1 hypothetical protein N599_24755 [Saccharopolyspora erythraea D]PFG96211.1 putative dehydrogenase [Saccharopolyspora erythraea NRRL 2338]QRK92739.1 Gfo/Idh/MocA family oxidoreductase [Saccharopolyspora erythraea]CAM02486.1 hypothetical protein SACE_3211 [Saccharopolyspora erythraea NRRL 2338]
MLQPLVVGLGRAGVGLHLRVLARARSCEQGLIAPGPVPAWDPRQEAGQRVPGLSVRDSLAAAVATTDPESTVAHVCTPPVARLEVIRQLGALGVRKLVVEKPLATGLDELLRIDRLRRELGLEVVVVAHWLASELTRRLAELVREQPFGALRAITFTQHKPRFSRSLSTNGHPTAFDVEVPHSLGVVLCLAGPARLLSAERTDMRVGDDVVLPGMGSARLALGHESGVLSEIFSDLTSPVQQRRVRLEFERGSATGHYPLSENDDHAQLTVDGPRRAHHVFRDDALTAFVVATYRAFQSGEPSAEAGFQLHSEAIRLMCEAKETARGSTSEEIST